MAFQTGTSTDYLDLLDDLITFATSNGWTVRMQTQEAASATVAAAGTGYTVSDQLTLAGGSGVSAPAVFNVDSVGGGGTVTGVSLVTAGLYDYPPSDPVVTTGGTGTGCTLNVTFNPATVDPKKVILEGSGSGSDEIFVSIRAEDLGGGVFNWQLQGHVGFQDLVDPTAQPNTSPGAHVPVNNAPITYWFFVTPRRIMAVFRMGSTYTSMYLGFLNPFGTSVSYPYPLIVMGCASSPTIFSNSTAGMGGLTDPLSLSSSIAGGAPAYVIDPGGTWKHVKNAGGTAGGRSKFTELVVWPCGHLQTTGATFQWSTLYNPANGSPAAVMGQTPDSGAPSGWRFPLLPCIVMERTPVEQILGQLDNVFWSGTLTETAGQAVSEDVYSEGLDDYLVFQNVNRTDHWTHLLVKRE